VLSSVRPVARAFDLAETTTKVGAPLLRFLAGPQAFKVDTTNKVGAPSLRFCKGGYRTADIMRKCGDRRDVPRFSASTGEIENPVNVPSVPGFQVSRGFKNPSNHPHIEHRVVRATLGLDLQSGTGGPFKPDVGLSGAVQWLSRVVLLLARVARIDAR
jgi:hypothetical protein